MRNPAILPDKTQKMTRVRYTSIDLWRGVACLMVILFHSTLYCESALDSPISCFIALTKQMWLGVPMFFVISGYCISASADSARNNPFQGISQYFWRRFRRIYPPYWIMLLLLCIASFTLENVLQSGLLLHNGDHPMNPPWWRSWWQIFGNLTLTEEWRFRLFGDHRSMPLGVAWTLCYEEQFYALCGLFLFVSPKRFFHLAALTSVLSLPWFGSANIKGFFFDGYWLMFASGILVYYSL